MSLREFVTYNRWQKVFSLLFAILIWFNVRQSVENNGGDPVVPEAYSRTFEHLPIRVLTLASDLEQVRVTPGEVTVVLRGRPELLNRLRPGRRGLRQPRRGPSSLLRPTSRPCQRTRCPTRLRLPTGGVDRAGRSIP